MLRAQRHHDCRCERSVGHIERPTEWEINLGAAPTKAAPSGTKIKNFDKIVIDRLALADPLLARLPSIRVWRIGHFPRRIPPGYVEEVRTGAPLIEDPGLRTFYERLKIITQGDLMTAERSQTIVRMNAGSYDHLREPGA